MKNSKWTRAAALLLILVLVLGLGACGSKETPETTVPETTVPETTVPETTVPETTVPETTVPETSVPVETEQGNANGETTAPETKPAETKPAETEAPTPVCYLTISCSTILNNMEDLEEGKEVLVPADGYLLYRTEVKFTPGESVFDVLQRVTRDRGIHMSSRFTPIYDSAYIEGIGNLYEFDCGPNSGWMYCVNSWYPNYGVSKYKVENGDEIQFNYTCDLGRDLPGGDWVEQNG